MQKKRKKYGRRLSVVLTDEVRGALAELKRLHRGRTLAELVRLAVVFAARREAERASGVGS